MEKRPWFRPTNQSNIFKVKIFKKGISKQAGTPAEIRRDKGSHGRSASSIILHKGDLSKYN